MDYAIEWDKSGERFYETGTKMGVLFPMDDDGEYGDGVAWNGLISVSESPSGAEPSDLYADDIKYLSMMSSEDFGATIEAYSSPEEFDECDGTVQAVAGLKLGQQKRRKFGFAYRTVLGDDIKGNDYGYIVHLIYNCLASPSEKAYSTINDSPEAITFSWELSTTPIPFSDEDHKEFKPTAHLEIDSTKADEDLLAAFEQILYGKAATTDPEAAAVPPRLPLPDEVIDLLTPVSPGP